jgi:acetyl-CoA carboxylase carboxyltransferase component
MVYLPPNAELRGGAWAVLDSLINPRYLETYADPESRAGVLEPEGIVEVKYKEKDLLKTIQRIDPTTLNVRKMQKYFFECFSQTFRFHFSCKSKCWRREQTKKRSPHWS